MGYIPQPRIHGVGTHPFCHYSFTKTKQQRMGGRRKVRNQPQSNGDDNAAAAAAAAEGEMEIVRGVARGKKRGRSERDDNAAAAAVAEEEETGVERGKKRGGKKTTAAAAAAPKKKMEEDEEEEVPTPKRMKPIEQLTKGLLESMGVDKDLSDEELDKLKNLGISTVGSLLGLSEDNLENNIGLMLGSVSAIMRFIEEQKGKNEQ